MTTSWLGYITHKGLLKTNTDVCLFTKPLSTARYFTQCGRHEDVSVCHFKPQITNKKKPVLSQHLCNSNLQCRQIVEMSMIHILLRQEYVHAFEVNIYGNGTTLWRQ